VCCYAKYFFSLGQPFDRHYRNDQGKESLVAPKENQDETILRLIQGCIRDDRGSQKELYKHFYALSMGICLRYANNQLDAASIINEGFFKIFSNIKKYDFTRPFAAWVSKIMTNTAIDFYRANLKFTNNEDLSNYEQASTTYDAIYDKLNYQDLLFMVQSLSPAYRTVFNLYAIEGYTHEEIAGILHISIGTSKSNLFKARAKLVEMLRASEEIKNVGAVGQRPPMLGGMDIND